MLAHDLVHGFEFAASPDEWLGAGDFQERIRLVDGQFVRAHARNSYIDADRISSTGQTCSVAAPGLTFRTTR